MEEYIWYWGTRRWTARPYRGVWTVEMNGYHVADIKGRSNLSLATLKKRLGKLGNLISLFEISEVVGDILHGQVEIGGDTYKLELEAGTGWTLSREEFDDIIVEDGVEYENVFVIGGAFITIEELDRLVAGLEREPGNFASSRQYPR